MPGGDLTEIGEKGINLSGGQKARVSLARAVYANRDIILMDDPISALDSNVKKKIFNQVFMNEMRTKTRVLVTHAVDFIDKVDRIIIMESGRIKYMGTYEELKHSEEIKHIVKTLASHSIKHNEHENDEPEAEGDDEEIPRSKSFMSINGSNITEDENKEDIEVGWNAYYNFFFTNYTWVIYVFLIPLFIAYSYLIVYNTFHIAHFVEEHKDKKKFWKYFGLIFVYPLGYGLIMVCIFLMI